MQPITELIPSLVSASPTVLALILGLAAVGLAAFAIYVVHKAFSGRERRE